VVAAEGRAAGDGVAEVGGDEDSVAEFGCFKLGRDHEGSPFGLHQAAA
jgi:hypothetical protein